MGTSMGFVLLQNRGFTQEELKNCLARRPLAGRKNRCAETVAFREDAKWLPYFEEWRCESCNCSSQSLEPLSQQFQTPVLAFTIFDSDILFVSYCDAEKQIFYDYVKPNCPEMEEYDAEIYQEGLPTFLLSLDGGDNVQRIEDVQKLKAIWDEEGLVFADDRMHNLLKFLGMQVVYDENDIPEGFIRIGI